MSLPLSPRSVSRLSRSIHPLTALLGGLLVGGAGVVAHAQTTPPSTPPSAAAPAVAGSAPADASATVYRGGVGRTGFAAQDATPPLSVAWQNTVAPLNGNQSTPVTDNGTVFFGTNGAVYAMNASDGSIKWTYPTAAALANPDVAHPGFFDCPATVADGKVYIGNDDGKLYAFDENTGALAWQVTTGGIVRSAPVVSDGVIYFGSGDSKLYAIREDNQQPVWGGEFRSSGQISTPAAISASDVFFVDGNDTLFCAALASGRLVWSLKFGDNIADSPPVLANGVVVVGSQRDLYGIAPSVGSTRWHLTLPASLTAQIAVSGDGSMIYAATSDDDIVAINTHGQVQWTAPLGSDTTIAPVVTNNSVVAITKSGIVRLLDASTGQVRWSYPLSSVAAPRRGRGTNISAAPLVTAGVIYTLSDNGTLTAFRANGSDNLPPSAALVSPVLNRAIAGAQIPYAIFVNDIGSGVNPSSVSLKADGATIPVVYDVDNGYITVRMVARSLGSPVPVAIATLSSGLHALTLTVSDWRGNQLTKTWNFTVNDALNPPGSALPQSQSPTTPPDASQQSGATPSATGSVADSGSAAGSSADPSAAGSGSGSSASPSSSGTTGARPTGSAGPGPVPGPVTGSGPVPSTPTGPGASPVAPSGTGGTGFPPAPPI